MILLSVSICVATFVAVVILLRRDGVSLGLPIAYLGSLLLIHVPGALAHILDRNDLMVQRRIFTQVGIGITAIASVCFLIGVVAAGRSRIVVVPQPANRTTFARFCLFGGAAATIVRFFYAIPSVVAIIDRGGVIWMLAIMVGLKAAVTRQNRIAFWKWIAILAIYPALMLILGGFLSYGVAAMMIVLSVVVVVARSGKRVLIGCAIASIVGISVFLSYFENRTEIRGAVWGGAAIDQRVDVSLGALKQITLFNPANESHLLALDARLNQNYFAGLAATRIANGDARYLYGRTIWEGFLAVIPRVFWPDKPIVAGSGSIVADMTGLQLSKSTSFGVGNVMEFQINFGIAGVVLGFILFGYLLRKLDRNAAAKYERGDLSSTFLYFLPAVAMIQPNGSMVEVIGGATSAWIAGYGWRWAWARWPKPIAYSALQPRAIARSLH
jgi:hypothetical protein